MNALVAETVIIRKSTDRWLSASCGLTLVKAT